MCGGRERNENRLTGCVVSAACGWGGEVQIESYSPRRGNIARQRHARCKSLILEQVCAHAHTISILAAWARSPTAWCGVTGRDGKILRHIASIRRGEMSARRLLRCAGGHCAQRPTCRGYINTDLLERYGHRNVGRRKGRRRQRH